MSIAASETVLPSSKVRLWAKFIIYSTLVSTFLFFVWQDYQTSLVTHQGNINLDNLVSAFAASVDSFAWLVLLGVFEAETWIIDDKTLKGSLKWLLGAITVVAYAIIVAAFFGYLSVKDFVGSYQPASIEQCESLDAEPLRRAAALDEYTENLAYSSCVADVEAGAVYQEQAGIFASSDVHQNMIWLAWTDVINSAAWLILVLILQIDIWLQLADKRSRNVRFVSNSVKGIIYLTFILCALHWLYQGTVVDFIDAVFWMLAFFLIELNLIAWADDVVRTEKATSSGDNKAA